MLLREEVLVELDEVDEMATVVVLDEMVGVLLGDEVVATTPTEVRDGPPFVERRADAATTAKRPTTRMAASISTIEDGVLTVPHLLKSGSNSQFQL